MITVININNRFKIKKWSFVMKKLLVLGVFLIWQITLLQAAHYTESGFPLAVNVGISTNRDIYNQFTQMVLPGINPDCVRRILVYDRRDDPLGGLIAIPKDDQIFSLDPRFILSISADFVDSDECPLEYLEKTAKKLKDIRIRNVQRSLRESVDVSPGSGTTEDDYRAVASRSVSPGYYPVNFGPRALSSASLFDPEPTILDIENMQMKQDLLSKMDLLEPSDLNDFLKYCLDGL